MSDREKTEQIVEELIKRLSATRESKTKMEHAVESAESLCLRFAHDAEVLHSAEKIKEQCQSALESVDVQIDLLSQLIDIFKEDKK